jgi:hypothetical protein
MYLPAILLRDYGWSGFLAFAVPNVVGCAAFGFIVKSSARSRRLVAAHERLMKWFSAVTVAFHGFFLAWISPRLFPEGISDAAAAAIAAGVFVGAGLCGIRLRWKWWLALGALVWAGSLALVVAHDGPTFEGPPQHLLFAGGDAAWLVPIMAFGFLLCPLVDLTFHRAMQKAKRPATFVVFAGAFSLMILLTCAYAQDAFAGLAPFIAAHLLLQAAFTVAVHSKLLVRSSGGARLPLDFALQLTLIVLSVILGFWVSHDPARGEAIYLRFLVFYGLVTPVLILATWRSSQGERPRAGGRETPNPTTPLWIPWVVILVCIPIFEAGLIGRRLWMPAAAIGVILVFFASLRRANRRRFALNVQNRVDS